MAVVIVPLLVLFLMVLLPIPVIGKDTRFAFLATAAAAFIIGGVGAAEIAPAIIGGVDSIAWVVLLILFAGIYTQSQLVLGSIETVLDFFRSVFANSTKGLIAAVLLSLTFAGSLIGSATAIASIIGILVIAPLDDAGFTPNQVGSILLSGSILGSVMPPMTNSVYTAASLLDVPLGPVVNITYFTAAIGVAIALFVSTRWVKSNRLPESMIPSETPGQILGQGWKKLIPLALFGVIVVLNTGFKIDILKYTDAFWNIFKPIPILRGFTNRFVQAMIVATLASMCYGNVRRQTMTWLAKGFKTGSGPVQHLLCAGIMIGAFRASGMLTQLVDMASVLPATGAKLGGGALLIVMGMLTGSAATAQTTILPLVGPIWMEGFGVTPTMAGVAGSHLAMAGQSFPPVCLLTFMLAAIISSMLNKPADSLKIMLLSLPVTVWFTVVGFLALFI